jgi:hypothetical protein
MNELTIDQIIDGILECDTETKQRLGQVLARHLRLESGPAGPDGGIDGYRDGPQGFVVFQSKLESKTIGAEKADQFFGMIHRKNADVGIYLAGRGYTEAFENNLNASLQSKRSQNPPTVHLLTLRDILSKSPKLMKAIDSLPELEDADKVIPEIHNS